MKSQVAAVLISLTLVSGGFSQTTLFTFDDLPMQPVNGLHHNGVAFGFGIGGMPSTDAMYNSFGPDLQEFVDISALEGNAAGVLTLTFDQPTSIVQFGVAFLEQGNNFFNVELYDPSMNLIGNFMTPYGGIGGSGPGTQGVVPAGDGQELFPETEFVYDGDDVGTAVIDFSVSAGDRFALDNLVIVPEPSSVVLLLSAFSGLGVWALRRRR